jgi:hypothetical protein
VTAAEQVSVEALATRVDGGFRELRGDIKAVLALIEQRRLDDATAHATMDQRMSSFERDRSVAEAFFSFGRWIGAAAFASAGLVIAYLSYH